LAGHRHCGCIGGFVGCGIDIGFNAVFLTRTMRRVCVIAPAHLAIDLPAVPENALDLPAPAPPRPSSRLHPRLWPARLALKIPCTRNHDREVDDGVHAGPFQRISIPGIQAMFACRGAGEEGGVVDRARRAGLCVGCGEEQVAPCARWLSRYCHGSGHCLARASGTNLWLCLPSVNPRSPLIF
jgi:hypothetical protein